MTRLASRLARLERAHTPPVQGTFVLWFVNDDGTHTNARTGETLTTAELRARGGYVIDLTAPAPSAHLAADPRGEQENRRA